MLAVGPAAFAADSTEQNIPQANDMKTKAGSREKSGTPGAASNIAKELGDLSEKSGGSQDKGGSSRSD